MTTVPCKLNVSQQGPAVVKKANIIQGYANKNIACRTHGNLSSGVLCRGTMSHLECWISKKIWPMVGHGLGGSTKRCRQKHGPGAKTERSGVIQRRENGKKAELPSFS